MTAAQLMTAALGAVLVLLAAGCEKIDVTGTAGDPVPMLFSSYAPRPVTKVDSDSFVSGTTLPDNSSFGVFAFYQGGDVENGIEAHWTDDWDNQIAGTQHPSPNFMFNQEVEYDGTDYTYSPVRYWPTNIENTISFWAYYPYDAYSADNSKALKFYESDGTTDYNSSSTGLPVVKYTVPSDPDKQIDLLFDSFANTDKTYLNCTPTLGVVPLTFKHALSWVEFQIIEGTGAVINSMSVSNIKWSGECTDVENLTWANQGNAATFSLNSVTVYNSIICSMLLMPQTIANDATLTINYDITFASSDPGHPDPIVYKGNSGNVLLKNATQANGTDPAGINTWEPGHHYIYKIRAGFERIEFEEVVVSADDWKTGNSNIPVPE